LLTAIKKKILKTDNIFYKFYFVLKPIVAVSAVPNQSLASTSMEPDTLSEKDSKSRKKDEGHKKNWSTLRRREVILSKISIYIVFMFISCHRLVIK
jgi:hypothetical protein